MTCFVVVCHCFVLWLSQHMRLASQSKLHGIVMFQIRLELFITLRNLLLRIRVLFNLTFQFTFTLSSILELAQARYFPCITSLKKQYSNPWEGSTSYYVIFLMINHIDLAKNYIRLKQMFIIMHSFFREVRIYMLALISPPTNMSRDWYMYSHILILWYSQVIMLSWVIYWRYFMYRAINIIYIQYNVKSHAIFASFTNLHINPYKATCFVEIVQLCKLSNLHAQ